MITIQQLITLYYEHAQSYYDSREPGNLRWGLERFFEPCPDLPIAEIGTPVLARLRDEHALAGQLSRSSINKALGYIRRMMTWAAEYGYADTTLSVAAQTVRNLRRGHMGARETNRVEAVDPQLVDLIRDQLKPQLRDYIDMMRLTGMRPGEARLMRFSNLELVATRAYVYTPARHKNANRGKPRYIAIVGDAFDLANRIIGDLRRGSLYQDREHLFSPDGDGRRPYAECSIGQAIRRAARRIEAVEWSPNQLRHLYATDKHAAGFDASEIQPVLGHATTSTTQIYIHEQKSRVVEAAIRLAS